MSALADKIKSKFKKSEGYRLAYEQRWTKSLRQIKGLYDGVTLSTLNGIAHTSSVYAKLTRSKTVPLIAKLYNMLFPTNDKHWGIYPTKIPKLSSKVLKMIQQEVQAQAQGQGAQVTVDMLEAAIRAYAALTCEKMEQVIEDQLNELNYHLLVKEAIQSGVYYGTGIIKGPLSVSKTVHRLRTGELNNFEYETVEEFSPYYEFVPIWNVYLDQNTFVQREMSDVFQLHEMTKNDLLDLGDRDDFKGDVIIDFLKTTKTGDYQKRFWETEIRASSSSPTMATVSDVNTYEVLEYYGKIERKDLISGGLLDGTDEDEDNVQRDVAASVWIAGEKIIKCAVVDEIPYHIFYFEKDESSIYGVGLPEIMSNSQSAYNIITRAMYDNATLSGITQLEVNRELLLDGVNYTEMYAGKVWPRDGKGQEASLPAIRPIVFPSHTDEFLKILNWIEEMSGKESHMPEGLFGEAATRSNETATAMSIRQGNNNLVIDALVRNFDMTTESVLNSIYNWNMKYHPDDNIKGDYNVMARGTSDLMAKEMKANSLNAVLQVIAGNPLLMQEFQKEIDISKLFKEILTTHGIRSNDILLTEQEQEQRENEQAAAQMQTQQENAAAMAAKGNTNTLPAPALTPNPNTEQQGQGGSLG